MTLAYVNFQLRCRIFFKLDEIVEPETIYLVHALRVCFQDGRG